MSDNINRCFYCGHQVIWQNDFNFEDYCMDGDGVVSIWDCPNCGSEYDIFIPIDSNE